jgi:hypothetical protein
MAPYTAIGPTRAPPTLWAQFQMDIFVPRSFTENQCVITRPQGGHPMPLNQPTRKFSTAMITMDVVLAPNSSTGTAMNIMDRAASTKPRGRNTRALLRSETLPIKNFDRA